jgi:hypothetical protein
MEAMSAQCPGAPRAIGSFAPALSHSPYTDQQYPLTRDIARFRHIGTPMDCTSARRQHGKRYPLYPLLSAAHSLNKSAYAPTFITRNHRWCLMRRAIAYFLMASVSLVSSLAVQAQSNQFGYIYQGTMSLSAVGAGSQFTFTATAGEYVSITMQNQGSELSGIQIRVQDANSNTVFNSNIVAPPTGTLGEMECNTGNNTAAGCWGNAVINLGPISALSSGTYTVSAFSTAGYGSLTFSVSSPVTGTALVVNGASTSTTSSYPGQSIIKPVSLVAGTQYTLNISETNGYLPAEQGVVLDPSGTVIANIAMAATCPTTCGLGQYTGGGYTTFTPVVTGTYNILLQEQTQMSGPNDYGPLWNTVTWLITSP